MSAEEITGSVETIEVEAEKILDEARIRANEIILKAKEEAARILASRVPLDDVKKECEQILNEAREKANKEVEESKKRASEIESSAGKKVGKITERIVNIITGVEVRWQL